MAEKNYSIRKTMSYKNSLKNENNDENEDA